MEDNPEMMYKLGSIESSVKSIEAKLDKSIHDNEDNFRTHDHRIGVLEQGQVRQLTINGFVSSIVALLVAIGMKVIHFG